MKTNEPNETYARAWMQLAWPKRSSARCRNCPLENGGRSVNITELAIRLGKIEKNALKIAHKLEQAKNGQE